MPPVGFNSYRSYQQNQQNQRQQRGSNQRQNPYQNNQNNQRQAPQHQMNPHLLNGYQQQLQQQYQQPYQQQYTGQQQYQPPYMGQQQYQPPYIGQQPYQPQASHQTPAQMPSQTSWQMPSQMPPQMPSQMPPQMPQDPMVSYEPIDEKTLNEIRASLGEPKHEAPSEQSVTVYALDKSLMETIGVFAQNEKNAFLYYKNLSELSNNNMQKRILLKISDTSKKHIGAYQEIYKNLSGGEYKIKDTEIITNTDFYEGLRFAILEETSLLDELNDLYEQIPDEKSLKSLNKMINRKISLINYLRNLQI